MIMTMVMRVTMVILTLQDERSQGESVVMLLFCICSPIAISWFFSFIKILFSGKEWPSFLTFFFVSSRHRHSQTRSSLMYFGTSARGSTDTHYVNL